MASPGSCNVHFKRLDTFTRVDATHLVRTYLSSLVVMRLIAPLISLDAQQLFCLTRLQVPVVSIHSRLVNIFRADRRLSSRLIRHIALQGLLATGLFPIKLFRNSSL